MAEEENRGPTVGDVMIPMRDGCVPMNCAADVLDIVRETAIAGMPVKRSFDADELLGFVLQSELEKAESEPGGGPRIVDVPWQPAHTVRVDVQLVDVPDARDHVHLVIDADDGLVGVLDVRPE